MCSHICSHDENWNSANRLNGNILRKFASFCIGDRVAGGRDRRGVGFLAKFARAGV